MIITPAPQRVEVRTRDRDVAAEAVNRIVAHEARIGSADPGEVDFAFLTVGYGDLTAASNLGHTLSMAEALVGQIYLVTVVSLIVGNLALRRRDPVSPG